MKKTFITMLTLVVIVAACTHAPFITELDKDLRSLLDGRSKTGSADFYILPEAGDLQNIPQDPLNPLTAEKVELGKMLFYETGVGFEAVHNSGYFTYSCASCHIPAAGFRPGRAQGIADGAYGFGENGEGRYVNPEYSENELDAQGARPLSMLNVAFVENTMWNGSFGGGGVNIGTEDKWNTSDGTHRNALGYAALETQNIAGLETHRMVYNKSLMQVYGYDAYFDAAFPDVSEEKRYSRETASLALSAYLRTLLSNEAPFQQWLKGDADAMTQEQKSGALLFFGKAGCWRCHYEPNLGSMDFHALGVEDLYENGGVKTSINDKRNLGRGGFTENQADMYKFRVPQLYNMADAPFYFHGASKRTLPELLDYFNAGVPENANVPVSQISEYFHPLNLNDSELLQLEAFLTEGLRDPNLERYVPSAVLSGMCFPNNDPQSKLDMDCQ